MEQLELYNRIEETLDKRVGEVRDDIKELTQTLTVFKRDCDDRIDRKLDRQWFKWVVGFIIIGLISVGGYAAANGAKIIEVSATINHHITK